jgi:hypothetical protein
MSTFTKALIDEIKAAPEPVQREVFDFLVFLRSRPRSQAEAPANLLPLAQTAWAADWNTPQEDEAWHGLRTEGRKRIPEWISKHSHAPRE